MSIQEIKEPDIIGKEVEVKTEEGETENEKSEKMVAALKRAFFNMIEEK